MRTCRCIKARSDCPDWAVVCDAGLLLSPELLPGDAGMSEADGVALLLVNCGSACRI